MAFQIHALPVHLFSDIFTLTEDECNRRHIHRMCVDAKPGFPCRVSLQDAEVGETIFLLNYEHQDNDTPYRASHAIFVRKNAQQIHLAPNEIPPSISDRLLSVRVFNTQHAMTIAHVIEGSTLALLLNTLFEDQTANYIHIHNAKPGCYAAKATRINSP